MPKISWKSKRLYFECGAGFFVLMLALLCVLVGTGVWQLQRAKYKTGLQTSYQNRLAEPLMKVIGEMPPAGPTRFRRLQITGRYDSGYQFLLDNRSGALDSGQRQAGYEVLTLFRLNLGGYILVNRGWLPAPADRAQLPDIAVANDERRISGILNIPEKGFTLGDIDTDASWPRRIQYVDFAELAGRLQHELYPAVLMLNADESDGYQRNWRPVLDGPDKHYGYALQWFAMALALIILFGYATKRNQRD